MSHIKLIHGDCLDQMKSIPEKSINMILCDLPYGQTSRNKWDVVIPFEPLWKQYERVISDNGAIILFANGMFTADLMYSNKKLWRYNLIWEKTTTTGFLNANRMPLRQHEDICVFYKKLPTYNPQKTYDHPRKVSTAAHKRNCVISSDYGEYKLSTYDSTERYPTSMLKFEIDKQEERESDSVLTFKTDKQQEAMHPTQKPVALLEYLIKTYTNEHDTVLDNAMGSGSTICAAINTGRNGIGIEKEEKNFSLAKKRIMKLVESKPERTVTID